MDKVHAIVAFLEGKKSLILAFAAVVLSFSVTNGLISPAIGSLLQSILSLFTAGAVAVQNTQGFVDYKLGKAK